MLHSENGSIMNDKDNNCNNGTSSPYRTCHIVKRPDFDGYGFNLHSEKGKPGQYIGKVDEKSPAEQAGLRQGDRIIEVNGVNIGNDTHKQVVQRIKAVINEVRLLVIDPTEYEKLNKQNNNKKSNETTTTTTTTITTTISPKNERSHKISDTDNKAMNDSNDMTGSVSPATSTKSQTNSVKSASNKTDESTFTLASTVTIGATNGHSMVDSTDSNNSEINSTKMSEPSSSGNGNDNNVMGADGNDVFKSNGNSATSQQQKSGLNLPMTAAEMRAKLLARKKYDPKNDSVDLRKKFEIIQKL